VQPSTMETGIVLDGFVSEKYESWTLFKRTYGKIISREQIIEFTQAQPDPTIFKKSPTKKKLSLKLNMNALGEHHLFELLGWNPTTIILTALLWKGKRQLTLSGLYQLI